MVEGYLAYCFSYFNTFGSTYIIKLGKHTQNGTTEWFAQFCLPERQRSHHTNEYQDVLDGGEVTAIRIYMRLANVNPISEECYEEDLGDDAHFVRFHAHPYIYDHSCFIKGISFDDDKKVVLFFGRQNRPKGRPFEAILGPANEDEL